MPVRHAEWPPGQHGYIFLFSLSQSRHARELGEFAIQRRMNIPPSSLPPARVSIPRHRFLLLQLLPSQPDHAKSPSRAVRSGLFQPESANQPGCNRSQHRPMSPRWHPLHASGTGGLLRGVFVLLQFSPARTWILQQNLVGQPTVLCE